MLAWHVVNEDFTLNYDLSDVEVCPGLELEYDGELELCRSGLHASVRLLDALLYGNSGVICRVEVGENYIESSDKLVSDYRKVIAVADCTEILQQFAIEVAEDVLHIFETEYPNDTRPRAAIEAAKAYLLNELSLKELNAARDAAYAAADAADAARAADSAFADDADADRDADSAVALSSARAAYAARDAAYAARDARDAARDARDAARDAADAARDAADAARAEKYNEYNNKLENMVLEYMGIE